jgi:hypothetical protein
VGGAPDILLTASALMAEDFLLLGVNDKSLFV